MTRPLLTIQPVSTERAALRAVSPQVTAQAAAQALEHMRALLPSYREVCGAAPYYYAAGEIQRLENQLVQVYSGDELEHMTRSIELQLTGLVHAIRSAKGRGVDLDA